MHQHNRKLHIKHMNITSCPTFANEANEFTCCSTSLEATVGRGSVGPFVGLNELDMWDVCEPVGASVVSIGGHPVLSKKNPLRISSLRIKVWFCKVMTFSSIVYLKRLSVVRPKLEF